MSYQLDLSRQDLLLTTLTGAWAREFEPDTAPVRRGRTVFGSVSGTSGHYCNPFFALSDPNTGEHSGEIYGVNLIYSGSYAASVEADSYGSLRVMAGVQSEGFHWTLAPGESFLTPEAVLTSSITGTLQFQSTSSVWRTTQIAQSGFRCTIFQSTSSVRRTTAKTEKNLYLHSYNTAICTNLQPKHSAYAFVCTDKDKQSHEKLVRSIRLCGDRPMFARPLSPDGALRKSARHPAGRRGERRRVPLCSGNGCPAGKSAGCPLPGRSVWSARP